MHKVIRAQPLNGLRTDLRYLPYLLKKHRELFDIFHEIFHETFHAKYSQ